MFLSISIYNFVSWNNKGTLYLHLYSRKPLSFNLLSHKQGVAVISKTWACPVLLWPTGLIHRRAAVLQLHYLCIWWRSEKNLECWFHMGVLQEGQGKLEIIQGRVVRMMKELEMGYFLKDWELSLLNLTKLWLRDHLIRVLMCSFGSRNVIIDSVSSRKQK